MPQIFPLMAAAIPRVRSRGQAILTSASASFKRPLRFQNLIHNRPTSPAAIDSRADPDFKLPPRSSLVVILLANVLLQVSFFIIVSSSSAYAEHLGGSATFSGLVIGIPTAFSGLALIPLMKFDQGNYTRPLHFACGAMVFGSVLYALAYKAKFLYLILLGRAVQGLGFTLWMYSKRYCSDPRIVGVRRRTTLAGWLVLGQGCGMSLGPFIGGLLYKVGFHSDVFNGYTSPAWIMAGIWVGFWAAAAVFFEDVPTDQAAPFAVELPSLSTSASPDSPPAQPPHPPTRIQPLTARQRGVIICMCWFAMTCFFILGAWESNIPVYGASPSSTLHFSPFASGNFIALGGAAAFPFLFLNLIFARRTQDRHVLALGSALGLAGLLLALGFLSHDARRGVGFGPLFVCWFLIALGFNLASTCTLSLLSKQLPGSWNGRTSLAIQYSNYAGRVAGAVWGGSGVKLGMRNFVGLEIAIIGVGALMFLTLWRELKAKTG